MSHVEVETQRTMAVGEGLATPSLRSMFSIEELSRRPSRAPDYVAENRALIALARVMATAPESILQKLTDTALVLCSAQSAGISILEEGDEKRNFHWRAIAGQWAFHVNEGTPRDFGPCGTVLDHNIALMCSHPERDFPYFGEVTPLLEEALLIPFYLGGEAVGTIWVVSHDEHRFDAEDLRLMTNLGDFTAAAYQTWLSVNATQRIAAIVESSDDAIISKDLNGIITTWNKGAERIFGYLADEVIGKPITILIPADRLQEEDEIIERIRRGQRIEHFETVRCRKHGSLIDVSLSVSPVRNVQGKIIGASKIARNISERKRSEEQITVLAREAEHRARNVLATVQATVNLAESDTPGGLKQAIEGRIQALANVHALFVESRWKGADLRTVITQETAPYCQGQNMRVRIEGPSLLLEPSTAQTIAVILHELATNAAKYGAWSAPQGHVRIEWSRTANGQFALRWSEAGGPAVEPPTRKGFGTRVMVSLIEQLKGEVNVDWRPEGMACKIAFQLRNGTASPA